MHASHPPSELRGRIVDPVGGARRPNPSEQKAPVPEVAWSGPGVPEVAWTGPGVSGSAEPGHAPGQASGAATLGLTVSGLEVTYADGTRAVDGVDLRVAPGEVVGLVGQSGSGKSTLALALLGLVEGEVAGSVALGGTTADLAVPGAADPWRWRRIALAFQHAAAGFNPVHRVIDQIAEPLTVHLGMQPTEARRRARELWDEAGLPEARAEAYPHELSGGEARRAMLAMALACGPEFLVADEPTAGLDAIRRGEILDVLRRRAARGTGLLIISHDLADLQGIADRILVLHGGRVVESGAAGAVLDDPRHPFTWRLVDSYPRLDPARDLAAGSGAAPLPATSGPSQGLPERPVVATGLTTGLTTGWATRTPGTVLGAVARWRDRRAAHRASDDPRRDGAATTEGCTYVRDCPQVISQCHRVNPRLEPLGDREVACLRGGLRVVLRAGAVSVRLGGRTIVDGIDLQVRAGETLALVGPSGSGKTTLARALTGLVTPSRGSVEVDVEPADARGPRGVQLLAQDPLDALNPRFDIAQLVGEPLAIAREGTSAERGERVRSALASVGLPTDEGFLDRRAHQLSGGQLQRVAVARALVADPLVLVADEPTSMLDAVEQARLLRLLRDRQDATGVGLIFITHDLPLVRKIAHRILVLDRGRVVESGAAHKVVGAPRHPTTQALLRLPGAARQDPSPHDRSPHDPSPHDTGQEDQ